jgi:putative endonuclease
VTRREVAARGEHLAKRHLEQLGYRIRAQNWRAREGEIDLVAEDQGTLVFVEVKARSGHSFGLPEEAVTRAKRRHLRATAQAFLEAHDLLELPWRIDVIAIDLSPAGAVDRLDHYPDAVRGDEDEGR